MENLMQITNPIPNACQNAVAGMPLSAGLPERIGPVKSQPAWRQLEHVLKNTQNSTTQSDKLRLALKCKLALLDRQLSEMAGYNKLLKKPDKNTRGKIGWVWMPLAQDAESGIGILKLNPALPVPLHDHPGRAGGLIVLNGIVETVQYQLDHSYHNRSNSLCKIKQTDKKNLRRDDVTFYTSSEGNIHALRAQNTECTLLAAYVQLEPCRPRSWYFPIVDYSEGKNMIVSRIKTASPFR
jgi:hypothetical protein